MPQSNPPIALSWLSWNEFSVNKKKDIFVVYCSVCYFEDICPIFVRFFFLKESILNSLLRHIEANDHHYSHRRFIRLQRAWTVNRTVNRNKFIDMVGKSWIKAGNLVTEIDQIKTITRCSWAKNVKKYWLFYNQLNSNSILTGFKILFLFIGRWALSPISVNAYYDMLANKMGE